VTEPTRQKPKKHTGEIRILTQNVQALPLHPQDEVVHDVELAASQAGIIGWQEIGPDRYQQAVDSLGPKWTTYWGGPEGDRVDDGKVPDNPSGYDTPISWRSKRWNFVNGGRVLLNDGVAKICPNRWATWVVLENKRTGLRAIFINVHFVAGAWNNEKDDIPQRQKMWREAWDVLKKTLVDLMNEYPDAVSALLGDFNANYDRDHEEFAPLRVGGRHGDMTFDGAIDHIIFFNSASAVWLVVGTETLPGRHSDHQGRRAVAQIVERG
jgi:hypothetical protein